MEKPIVINSEIAVDDDTFAPVVVLTMAVPLKASHEVDPEEARETLAKNIVTAFEDYAKVNKPPEVDKALPLSEYFNK